MEFDVSFFLIPVIVVLVSFLGSAINVVREYERLVVFRLGRLIGEKGPGLVLIIPIVDRVVRVSLRIVTLDVPTQEVITKDNVTTSVNAVVYYRVIDPNRSVNNVEEYTVATAQLAQTTLRSVAGQADLDELLSERDKLNQQIQKILDDATDVWGIKVTAVEIKDVIIPEGLQRAISRQATAERERRAVVVQALGEKEAAEKIAEAAKILNSQEGGFYVRLLRSLPEIAQQSGNMLAFPLPVELRHLFPPLGKNSDDD
ncbi:slipin family protein [Dethiobacter alkaliphilus]|uniref:Band 7 protein n=1 Tax=Dethiobacter alkaliphilus AHT 1 TaxID=555088 RepID=C0GK13_DETAL|nr:slipin family protein [Dethiobacter alkaliphilus]EEG76283.1 band 7 protein [Dethiobacter alkaliphilus AHT 1]